MPLYGSLRTGDEGFGGRVGEGAVSVVMMGLVLLIRALQAVILWFARPDIKLLHVNEGSVSTHRKGRAKRLIDGNSTKYCLYHHKTNRFLQINKSRAADTGGFTVLLPHRAKSQ